MDINDIVNYCDDLYTRNETYYRCESCNNECQGNCENCLDKIHFGDKRRYNCENIKNYYICKYIYKYSSEIQYLFETHHTLKELNHMKILSIGCGPCTDLFGIINTICDNKLDVLIEYTGIDLNDIWKDIHDFINENNNEIINTHFIYDDVFDIVKKDEFKDILNTNILIFQYVLSDIIKYKTDKETEDFIKKIVDEIILNLENNSFIIFNDINYFDSRKYFDYMLNEIRNRGIDIQYQSHHFNNNVRKSHYDYGHEYNSNDVKLDIPQEILDQYRPWTFCSSAQLIIRKGGNLNDSKCKSKN